MPQSSAPIVGEQFTDVDWRDLHGSESAIVGDYDGTAYKLTLPTDSDIITLGSTTQRSTAVVAGFVHRIPAGQTEPLTIPAAVGAARTDRVNLRYSEAHTGLPGPVRLVVVAGAAGAGAPNYDDTAPGAQDLPLYLITRQPGQSLSQATVLDVRRRSGRSLIVPDLAALPNDPLGTTAWWKGATYRRQLGGSGVAEWVRDSRAPYAVAAGALSVPTIAPGNTITTARVTYPAGRFTALPILQLSSTEVRYSVGIVPGSADVNGFTMFVGNYSDALPGSSSNLGVHWLATQMTPTSAVG